MLHQSTREYDTYPFPIASTLTNFAEGVALTFIQQNGQSVLTIPGTAAGTDKFAGVSRSQWNDPLTGVYMETVTVNATTYTATLSNALAGNGTELLAYDTNTTSDLTSQTAASPASGFVQTTNGSTTITFNSNAAGHVVNVQYRYNLTAQQSLALAGTGIPGNQAPQVTGKLDVIRKGIVYTDQFNAGIDWTTWAALASTSGVIVGNSGQFTLGALTAGAVVPNAVITQIPTSDLPFLGIYFSC